MKAVIFNNKIYADRKIKYFKYEYGGDFQSLLWDVERYDRRIYHEETLTLHYISDEFYEDENHTDTEDIVETLIDYGYEEFEEVEVD